MKFQVWRRQDLHIYKTFLLKPVSEGIQRQFAYMVVAMRANWSKRQSNGIMNYKLNNINLTIYQNYKLEYFSNEPILWEMFDAIISLMALYFVNFSGILVTYGFLKKSRKVSGLIPVLKASLMFVVRRYWRLVDVHNRKLVFAELWYLFSSYQKLSLFDANWIVKGIVIGY